jgi:hypothetical protein
MCNTQFILDGGPQILSDSEINTPVYSETICCGSNNCNKGDVIKLNTKLLLLLLIFLIYSKLFKYI